jgi:hypothetical protein
MQTTVLLLAVLRHSAVNAWDFIFPALSSFLVVDFSRMGFRFSVSHGHQNMVACRFPPLVKRRKMHV